MSVNIAAALLGAIVIAILIGFRVSQKKRQENFRRELVENYRQEADK